MRPIYIFDLDGTLALNHHRQHLLETTPRQWDLWNKACANDEPNVPLFRVLASLFYHQSAEIVIMTGRDAAVRTETMAWFECHGWHYPIGDELLMRPEGDRTEDTELKKQWFMSWPEEKRARVAAVFEDRKRMVDMWRSLGVQCWQVAPGDF